LALREDAPLALQKDAPLALREDAPYALRHQVARATHLSAGNACVDERQKFGGQDLKRFLAWLR
jgi:hypothetical protein